MAPSVRCLRVCAFYGHAWHRGTRVHTLRLGRVRCRQAGDIGLGDVPERPIGNWLAAVEGRGGNEPEITVQQIEVHTVRPRLGRRKHSGRPRRPMIYTYDNAHGANVQISRPRPRSCMHTMDPSTNEGAVACQRFTGPSNGETFKTDVVTIGTHARVAGCSTSCSKKTFFSDRTP